MIQKMHFLSLAEAIAQAKNYRDRLILVYGSHAQTSMAAISQQEQWPALNLGQHLSGDLLHLPQHERAHTVPALFSKLVSEFQADILILIHPEILFDPVLAVDPIRLFLNNARNRTLVVQWPGKVSPTSLTYATPSHPEYRSWRLSELGETILINADEDD